MTKFFIKNLPVKNFKIVNLFGQEVLNIENHNEDKPISVSLLSSGSYFIKGIESTFFKIIKAD